MSYLSSKGQFSINTSILKDIRVNNEYKNLEFYYIENEEPCIIMHFEKLEDAYTSLNFFKQKLIQAQLEEE
ncbi:MAG: hypothetical protein E7373_06555 [Clostridiales bacterium]|nr:hypothetical protein [Clostridiales bacterium]